MALTFSIEEQTVQVPGLPRIQFRVNPVDTAIVELVIGGKNSPDNYNRDGEVCTVIASFKRNGGPIDTQYVPVLPGPLDPANPVYPTTDPRYNNQADRYGNPAQAGQPGQRNPDGTPYNSAGDRDRYGNPATQAPGQPYLSGDRDRYGSNPAQAGQPIPPSVNKNAVRADNWDSAGKQIPLADSTGKPMPEYAKPVGQPKPLA